MGIFETRKVASVCSKIVTAKGNELVESPLLGWLERDSLLRDNDDLRAAQEIVLFLLGHRHIQTRRRAIPIVARWHQYHQWAVEEIFRNEQVIGAVRNVLEGPGAGEVLLSDWLTYLPQFGFRTEQLEALARGYLDPRYGISAGALVARWLFHMGNRREGLREMSNIFLKASKPVELKLVLSAAEKLVVYELVLGFELTGAGDTYRGGMWTPPADLRVAFRSLERGMRVPLPRYNKGEERKRALRLLWATNQAARGLPVERPLLMGLSLDKWEEVVADLYSQRTASRTAVLRLVQG